MKGGGNTKNSDLKAYISKIRDGDREAFNLVYNEMKKPVYTVALRIVGDESCAQDITQEVFIKLFLSPPSPKVNNPRAWIFTIAHNLSVDILRKRQALSLENLDEELVDPMNTLSQSLDIKSAIQRLGETERKILVLHLNADLKFSDIAKITGLTLSSVYRRYKKALKSLRDYLEVTL